MATREILNHMRIQDLDEELGKAAAPGQGSWLLGFMLLPPGFLLVQFDISVLFTEIENTPD